VSKDCEKTTNIVNINIAKVFKLTKLFIYYLLNVDERIFQSYNSNIELFLALLNNKKELIFVFKRN